MQTNVFGLGSKVARRCVSGTFRLLRYCVFKILADAGRYCLVGASSEFQSFVLRPFCSTHLPACMMEFPGLRFKVSG